jgi:hypothetical protein
MGLTAFHTEEAKECAGAMWGSVFWNLYFGICILEGNVECGMRNSSIRRMFWAFEKECREISKEYIFAFLLGNIIVGDIIHLFIYLLIHLLVRTMAGEKSKETFSNNNTVRITLMRKCRNMGKMPCKILWTPRRPSILFECSKFQPKHHNIAKNPRVREWSERAEWKRGGWRTNDAKCREN